MRNGSLLNILSIGILYMKWHGTFRNNTPRLYVAAVLFAIYRLGGSNIVNLVITYGIFNEICARVCLSLSGCSYIIIPLWFMRLIFQYLHHSFASTGAVRWGGSRLYNFSSAWDKTLIAMGQITQCIATAFLCLVGFYIGTSHCQLNAV